MFDIASLSVNVNQCGYVSSITRLPMPGRGLKVGVGKYCSEVTAAQPANHRTAPPQRESLAAYTATRRVNDAQTGADSTQVKGKPTATHGPEKAHSATEATEAQLLFYVFYVFKELVYGVVRGVLPANRLTRSITVLD